MSSPDFVKDAFAEISEMDKNKLDADERVKRLLSSQDTQIGTINYGGVEIRFRLFLSKSLRHKMVKIKSQLDTSNDEESLALSEKSMYDVLGSLCTEPPWNTWETWAYVDEKLKDMGGVQSIFLQVLSRIAQTADDVKNFRNKQ